jgi:glycosyltransferase involved in cell wall biosynthesis
MHTIITICWGDYWERYGKRWSEAALAITSKPEIIVVSDKPIDTPFKVVYNDSKHAGLARNAGIQVATGDYVSCSDIDDIPYPCYFDGVDGKHDIIGFTLDIEGWGRMKPNPYMWIKALELNATNPLIVSSAVKRELLLKHPYRNVGWEDWALWLDLRKAGATVKFDMTPRYFYSRPQGSLATVNTMAKTEEIREMKKQGVW